ncbi:MAG: nucleotide kinase domain-containing protein [Candidatus Thiodiazotropha sp.]
MFLVKKYPSKSKVYNQYWHFAKLRQDIFFDRISGKCHPWSDDDVLNTYKFTNAYRASDRVSQYLIKNVIYTGNHNVAEVFFRTILFKLFNKIETWQILIDSFGEVCIKDFSFEDYDRVLTNALSNGKRIYSAAYIMPSRGYPSIHKKKHRMHLDLISKMLTDDLPNKVSTTKSLKEVFNLLLSYPGIGKFLAYQYTIDLNYSDIINYSEMDFVVAGPGAVNGIKKCFTDTDGLSYEDIVKYVTDNQDHEFERLNIPFKNLWGRPLQLIDCQNLFCEIDKYSRVKFPEYSYLTGRTRIKQKYSENKNCISYWYPPKWGLNENIKSGITP